MAVKDTSARLEWKFRETVLERSGEGRLKMGCSMHAAARALVQREEKKVAELRVGGHCWYGPHSWRAAAKKVNKVA